VKTWGAFWLQGLLVKGNLRSLGPGAGFKDERIIITAQALECEIHPPLLTQTSVPAHSDESVQMDGS